MKPSVYIETTIPSYYTARISRDVVIAGRQATTRDWWDTRLSHFRAFISQVVAGEAAAGAPAAARDRLLALKPFTMLEVTTDALDIARMANKIKEICQAGGWQCPVICTPEELMGV